MQLRALFSYVFVLAAVSWFAPSALLGQALPPAAVDAHDEPDLGLSHRHIVLLSSDLEFIWGSYFFGVNNKTSSAQRFKTRVMLPKESIDFRAQDGLTDGDLQLGTQGELWLDKEFPPGLSLVAVGFQAKVRKYGDDTLTFEAPIRLDEFSLGAPSNSQLTLRAAAFKDGVPPMLQGGQYQGIISEQPLPEGSRVQVVISGLPKERGNLWIVGLITALLMAAGSLALALKTRPAPHDLSSEEYSL